MMDLTKDSIMKILESSRLDLRRLGVKKQTLLGSFARGDARPESDVDFLVEFEPGRGLFEDHSDLLLLLQDLFEREVDLVKPHLVREELRPYLLEGERYEARI